MMFTPVLLSPHPHAQVESALVHHPAVAEAAVVPMEHAIKGQALYAYVTLMEVRGKGWKRWPGAMSGAGCWAGEAQSMRGTLMRGT